MTKTVLIKRKALFGDCDPAGIVYTPRFSHFAVEAVHEALDVWLEGHGMKLLLKNDLLLPVRALAIDFTHPVAWDDEMHISVSISKVGERSISFIVKGMVLDNVLAFTATLTKVTVNVKTRESIAIPTDIKQVLSSKVAG